MSTLKSPVALYQALIEANVSKETAATAAQSLVEDIGSVVANLATKQDIQQGLDMLEAKVDSKLSGLESRMDSKLSGLEARMDSKLANIDARFKVQNIYLAIIGVITASSSPIFAPLVKAIEHLIH
ncbi:hypothetical protein [Acidithiobacillus ferriphilus]|uniref:hypothetical protein n=1 Tax=Acidithiobacillus ferriphilus TaxID=1689834 RepID=UPI002DBF50DE|nr:hypothetical protein [Acidithiobacillus ferriphilus]MEB8475564.1 hypothetical protein [Acidithiobacillus ferriphilus]